MELRICHLYNDILNLYGDRGNIICLQKRLHWRGIDCSLTKLPLGSTESLAPFDLVFIGGGMEFDTQLLSQELRSGRARELRAAVEDGVSFLAVCSGYQLLGSYCQDAKGEKTAMAGAVDMYTEAGGSRMTGNYVFTLGEKSGGHQIVGFENHLGRTWLSSGLEPLGTTSTGHGNNGRDCGEGLRYKNVFGTYSYGPVLPKNPALCDHILLTALERRYGKVSLEPLDDGVEQAAHSAIAEKIQRTENS